MSEIDSTPPRYCNVCQCDTDRYKDGHCKPCARLGSKRWAAANKERVKANNAAWNAKNAERVKAEKSKRYQENRDENIKKAADYYLQNREKAKAYARAKRSQDVEAAIERAREWRRKFPEKASQSTKSWQERNKDKVAVYKQNRRCKTVDTLSPELRSKLFTLQRGKCACCGLPLGKNYHMDHILPLALGGTNTDDNIQLLRQVCNNQKYKKHPVDFMQQRGFLL